MSPPVAWASVFNIVWMRSVTDVPTPIEYTVTSAFCAILIVSSVVYLFPRDSAPSDTRKIILRRSFARVRNNCAAAYTASLILLVPFPPQSWTLGFAGKLGVPGCPIVGGGAVAE